MPYQGNQGRERKSFSGGSRFGGSSGGQRRSFSGPREMHKVKCSACGKDAEVPFKPKEGLPVYCRDCYMKNKEGSGPKEFKAKPKKEKEDVEEDNESDDEEEF